jgi:hypothetical protein
MGWRGGERRIEQRDEVSACESLVAVWFNHDTRNGAAAGVFPDFVVPALSRSRRQPSAFDHEKIPLFAVADRIIACTAPLINSGAYKNVVSLASRFVSWTPGYVARRLASHFCPGFLLNWRER